MNAALAGAASGVAIPLALHVSGLLRDRSGLTVLVIAIAFFYPVFAVDHGGLALHAALFLAFAGAALWASKRSTLMLAALLALHGALDIVLGQASHPGPDWWPPFCATLDICAALVIALLVRSGRIPA